MQSFDGKIARNKSGFVNTIYKMSNAGGRLQTATSKSSCGSPSGNIVSALARTTSTRQRNGGTPQRGGADRTTDEFGMPAVPRYRNTKETKVPGS